MIHFNFLYILKQGVENEIVTLKQSKSAKEKELAVVLEELQQKKQIAGSTEVLLTADNLQHQIIPVIDVILDIGNPHFQ